MNGEQPTRTAMLWHLPLFVGIGMVIGSMISMATDFGVFRMRETIILNQDVFVEQYLTGMLVTHALIVSGMIVSTLRLLFCVFTKRRARSGDGPTE